MFRYSFDVFDTLLTRTLLSPLDVFRCVQHRLLSNKCSYADIPEEIIKSFVPARIWMEFKARRQSSREDEPLSEIYALFVREFALAPVVADALLEAELAVERLCSVPVGHNCRKVSRLRETSPSMIYVSDMYLPPAFIKELLERHGLWLEGDSLYVSGSIGFTKGHGSLYRHILDREGVAAADPSIHCGDTTCRGPFGKAYRAGDIEAVSFQPETMTFPATP